MSAENLNGKEVIIHSLAEWQDLVFKYGEMGMQLERERIIELLEDFDFSCIWRQIGWPNSYESFDAEELIALIKGENNADV